MRPTHLSQRGLSLVELLIGLALGLFVVAAAMTLLAGQIREQRSLGVEQRLMQELRSASDVITRDLRRAGHWGAAAAAAPGASALVANPYAALSAAAAASDAIGFRYSRDAVENGIVDANEEFGVRLRHGVVELLLGTAWQALTDIGTLRVETLRITPSVETTSLADHCSDCVPPPCVPQQQVRRVEVLLTARAAADASVVRSLRSEVRVRNDLVSAGCPA
jgi:type IV pilus assembly protein PilW